MKYQAFGSPNSTVKRQNSSRYRCLLVSIVLLIAAYVGFGPTFHGAAGPNAVFVSFAAPTERPVDSRPESPLPQSEEVPEIDQDDVEQGFLPGSKSPLPQRLVFPPEPSSEYATLNVNYHSKRAALRSYQERKHLGPLRIHTFYTVDCTKHSLWQVLALEQSWHRVKQGGFISRIIAGCKAGSEKAGLWSKSILPPSVEETRFGSYYTPESSTLPDGTYYAPYNRPNAIWYWLNHTDLTEEIFVLLDPDMYYMHRLSVASVARGQPAAQYYGYMEGTAFERYVCPLCPDKHQAYQRGGMHSKKQYSVGPPWMLHIDDFRTIMPTWVNLVSMLRKIDDIWIIEMVAYAVAAAFHGLPHKLIQYGMIDNVRQAPLWDERSNTIVKPNADTDHQQVALLHYCYTWEVGEVTPRTPDEGAKQHERMVKRDKTENSPVIDYYHWSKYRMPSDWPGGKGAYNHDILKCNSPLMQEIHTTEALPRISDVTLAANWRRTMVFLRTYLPALNEALTLWKKNVLRCHVPTAQEEQEFEESLARFESGVAGAVDPTGTQAPEKFMKILNLAPQLRTSHPTYWISKYVIESVNNDLSSVTFVPAREARAKIFEALRREFNVSR